MSNWLDPPIDDVETARQWRLRFSVLRKEQRGARWLTVFENADLDEALSRARRESAWEVGVFVNGMFYWSTRYPDLFNTTVIEIARHEVGGDARPRPEREGDDAWACGWQTQRLGDQALPRV